MFNIIFNPCFLDVPRVHCSTFFFFFPSDQPIRGFVSNQFALSAATLLCFSFCYCLFISLLVRRNRRNATLTLLDYMFLVVVALSFTFSPGTTISSFDWTGLIVHIWGLVPHTLFQTNLASGLKIFINDFMQLCWCWLFAVEHCYTFFRMWLLVCLLFACWVVL